MRVALGHGQEARALAAYAGLDGKRAATVNAQRGGKQVSLAGRQMADDLVGHGVVQIVLGNELRQHFLGLVVQHQSGEEVARAEIDSVAERDHADAGHAALYLAIKQIHVLAAAAHVLLGIQGSQRGNLVAQARRALEVQCLAGLVHVGAHLVDDFAALSFQEHAQMAHVTLVVLCADHVDARARCSVRSDIAGTGASGC